MTKVTHIALLLSNLLCAASYAALQPGEGIVLNSATGNYLISYRDGAGTANDPLVQLPFIPSTKIDPKLSSTTKILNNVTILYEYTLSNSVSAKQSIMDMEIYGLPSNANISGTTTTITEGSKQMDLFQPTLAVPNINWYGSGARGSGWVNIGWHYNYDSDPPSPLLGIRPGITQGGFSLTSLDLPGLFSVKLLGGGTGHVGYPGYAPDGDISILIDQLEDNDFVPRNAAAPMIAVPVPYNAAVTLERIQAHAHTWIAKQLLDSVFSGQLDRLFQSAISAYRLNQPLVGKQHLDSLRTLIKQQQPNADKQVATITPIAMPPAKIDLLAARILYFNLGYVKRR